MYRFCTRSLRYPSMDLPAMRLFNLVSSIRCPVHDRVATSIELQAAEGAATELVFTTCCDSLQLAIQAALRPRRSTADDTSVTTRPTGNGSTNVMAAL